jgi:uncharacterized membrane-anchored protein
LRLVAIEAFVLAAALTVLRLFTGDVELGVVQVIATAIVSGITFLFMRQFALRMAGPGPAPPPLVRTAASEVVLVLLVVGPGLLLDFLGGPLDLVAEVVRAVGSPLVFGTTIGLGAFLVWLLAFESRHGPVDLHD